MTNTRSKSVKCRWPFIVMWSRPLAKQQRCIVIQQKKRQRHRAKEQTAYKERSNNDETAYKEQSNNDEARLTQRAG